MSLANQWLYSAVNAVETRPVLAVFQSRFLVPFFSCILFLRMSASERFGCAYYILFFCVKRHASLQRDGGCACCARALLVVLVACCFCCHNLVCSETGHWMLFLSTRRWYWCQGSRRSRASTSWKARVPTSIVHARVSEIYMYFRRKNTFHQPLSQNTSTMQILSWFYGAIILCDCALTGKSTTTKLKDF